MKRIILLFIFCLNLCLVFNKQGGISIKVGSEVQAQGIIYGASGIGYQQVGSFLVGGFYPSSFRILPPYESVDGTQYDFYQIGVGYDNTHGSYGIYDAYYPNTSPTSPDPKCSLCTQVKIPSVGIYNTLTQLNIGGEGFGAENNVQQNFNSGGTIANDPLFDPSFPPEDQSFNIDERMSNGNDVTTETQTIDAPYGTITITQTTTTNGDGTSSVSTETSTETDDGIKYDEIQSSNLNYDGTVASTQNITTTDDGDGHTTKNSAIINYEYNDDGTQASVQNSLSSTDQNGNTTNNVVTTTSNADGTTASTQNITTTDDGDGHTTKSIETTNYTYNEDGTAATAQDVTSSTDENGNTTNTKSTTTYNADGTSSTTSQSVVVNPNGTFTVTLASSTQNAEGINASSSSSSFSSSMDNNVSLVSLEGLSNSNTPTNGTTTAEDIYSKYFPAFFNGSNGIIFQSTLVNASGSSFTSPSQTATIDADGFFILKDATGKTSQALAFTFLTNTPTGLTTETVFSPAFEDLTPIQQQAVEGHELIHQLDLNLYCEEYCNDHDQYMKDTEVAAYTYLIGIADENGDYNLKAKAQEQLKLWEDAGGQPTFIASNPPLPDPIQP